MKIYHGIYINGNAYSRKSIFATELASEDPEAWDKREVKRVARAKKAKERGVKIPDYALKPMKASLYEIKLSEQFLEILDKKSRMSSQLNYIFEDLTILVPKDILQTLRNVRRDVHFTIYADKGIAALAIVHSMDSFNRKTGIETARAKWIKAYRILSIHKYRLEDPTIDYYWADDQ